MIFNPGDSEHVDGAESTGQNNRVSAGYGLPSDLVPQRDKNGDIVYGNDGKPVLVQHIGELDYATPEMVSNAVWPYIPEAEVDIEIDVTSFGGSDYKSVDPFGTKFEIYIDAPMLKIDTDRLAECNLNGNKLKEVSSGRFVYTVEDLRENERNYGYNDASGNKVSALRKDVKPGTLKDYPEVNQKGERKRLPFKVNGIVTAGEIKISSDEDMVVYHSKTFNITNAPRVGEITYGTANTPVPKDAFVSFELARNHNRIGVMTITEDGKFSFRLRKEYEFYWEGDEVIIRYQASDNKVYTLESLPKSSNHGTLLDLKNLFAHLKEGNGINLIEVTSNSGN